MYLTMDFNLTSPSIIEDILKQAAERCILPYYKQLQSRQIETKSGPDDLVTIADKESEAFITRELQEQFPDHVIFGEESFYADADRLKDTISRAADRPIWIIDPVDGTHNFAHGKRHFAVLLACVVDGITKYGWIYDVLGDATIFAEKGKGATLDGAPLHITDVPSSLASASGYAAKKFFKKDAKQAVTDLEHCVAEQTTLRCSAHEYWAVATGQRQYIISTKMKPWDHLAGSLIVREAGGVVRKFDMTPYDLQTGHRGAMIVAANEDIWQKIYETTAKYFGPAPASS